MAPRAVDAMGDGWPGEDVKLGEFEEQSVSCTLQSPVSSGVVERHVHVHRSLSD